MNGTDARVPSVRMRCAHTCVNIHGPSLSPLPRCTVHCTQAHRHDHTSIRKSAHAHRRYLLSCCVCVCVSLSLSVSLFLSLFRPLPSPSSLCAYICKDIREALTKSVATHADQKRQRVGIVWATPGTRTHTHTASINTATDGRKAQIHLSLTEEGPLHVEDIHARHALVQHARVLERALQVAHLLRRLQRALVARTVAVHSVAVALARGAGAADAADIEPALVRVRPAPLAKRPGRALVVLGALRLLDPSAWRRGPVAHVMRS